MVQVIHDVHYLESIIWNIVMILRRIGNRFQRVIGNVPAGFQFPPMEIFIHSPTPREKMLRQPFGISQMANTPMP